MIRGFMEGFRRGRDEAVADFANRDPRTPPEPDAREDAVILEAGDRELIGRLEAQVRELEAIREDNRRLIADMAEEIEGLRAALDDAAAPSAPFEDILRLPGVETWLRKRFHPDKYPDASEEQQRALTEATQKINAAYAAMRKGTGGRSGPEPR
jgi:hypothetical protein